MEDARNVYSTRVTPIQRVSNLFDSPYVYEFTAHGSKDYVRQSLANVGVIEDANGNYWKKVDEKEATGIGGLKQGYNKIGEEYYKNVELKDVKPYYLTGVYDRPYAEESSTAQFMTKTAWIERAGQTGKEPRIQSIIFDKNQPLASPQDVIARLRERGEIELATQAEDSVNKNDWRSFFDIFNKANKKKLLDGMRIPPVRRWEQGEWHGGGVEPEDLIGDGTKLNYIGTSWIRSPEDMFYKLELKPDLEKQKPPEFEKWDNVKKEKWYREQGAISPQWSEKIEKIKPEGFDKWLDNEQKRWLYDNGAAIKTMRKGGLMALDWFSPDPNAQKPKILTRIAIEYGAEPYSRLKRYLQLYNPNTPIKYGYGGESRIGDLEATTTKAKNEGQIHIGTYGNERFNIPVKNGVFGGEGEILYGDTHAMNNLAKYTVITTNLDYKNNVLSESGGKIKVNRGIVTPDTKFIWGYAGDVVDSRLVKASKDVNSLENWETLLDFQKQIKDIGGENKVVLALGNHELPYLMLDKNGMPIDQISGIDYSNINRNRALNKLLTENILNGNINAIGLLTDGILPHSQPSLELFTEWVGKDTEYIVKDANERLVNAVKNKDFSDKLFKIGKYDANSVIGKTGEGVGGIFWYRIGESDQKFTTYPFKIFVGHTPATTRGGLSWGVQDRAGATYLDTAQWLPDYNKLKDFSMNHYADTPIVKSIKTGEIFAKPDADNTITFPLSPEQKININRTLDIIKSVFNDADYEVILKDGQNIIKFNLPERAFKNENIKRLMGDIQKYKVEDLSNIDSPNIRQFDIADAKVMPKDVAIEIQNYILNNKGRVYGSFVEWLKLNNAIRPNDVDVIFSDKGKAMQDIAEILKRKGYTVNVKIKEIQVQNPKGEWETILNIVSEAEHANMMKDRNYTPKTSVLPNGLETETLGTQLLNQAFGTLAQNSPKVEVRGRKVVKIAPDVVKIAKLEDLPVLSDANLFKSYADNQIGLKIQVPENITKEQLVEFTNKVKDLLSSDDGKLNYGLASGYPNPYSPTHLYLGLLDEMSISELKYLQDRVDNIAKDMGYKQGDFKIQAGLTLGELSGNKIAAETLQDVMRSQSKMALQSERGSLGETNRFRIQADISEFGTSDLAIGRLSDEIRNKREKSYKIDDTINREKLAEEDYPPQAPQNEYDGKLGEPEGILALGKVDVSPLLSLPEEAILGNDNSDSAEYNEMMVEEDRKRYYDYDNVDERLELAIPSEYQALEMRGRYYPVTTGYKGRYGKVGYQPQLIMKTPPRPLEYPVRKPQYPPYQPPPEIPVQRPAYEPYRYPTRWYGIPPRPIVKPTAPLPIKPSKSEGEVEERRVYPDGTYTHRQGKVWFILPPPYRQEDVIYSKYPPAGVHKFATGRGSAKKTAQILGELPPNDVNIDMGWVKVHIRGKASARDVGGKVKGDVEVMFGKGKEGWIQPTKEEMVKEEIKKPKEIVRFEETAREEVIAPQEKVESEETIFAMPNVGGERKTEGAFINIMNVSNPDVMAHYVIPNTVQEDEEEEEVRKKVLESEDENNKSPQPETPVNTTTGAFREDEKFLKVINTETNIFKMPPDEKDAQGKSREFTGAFRKAKDEGLNKKLMWQYGDKKVYSVNGAYIRDEFSIEYPEARNFTMGGNYKAYHHFIPEKEYWVEENLLSHIDDFKGTALHEIVEPDAMGNGRGTMRNGEYNKPYDNAHEKVANPIEFYGREHPENLDMMIQVALRGGWKELLTQAKIEERARKSQYRLPTLKNRNYEKTDIEKFEKILAKGNSPKKRKKRHIIPLNKISSPHYLHHILPESSFNGRV
jgi:type III secretion system FlhB-like substrate exporter